MGLFDWLKPPPPLDPEIRRLIERAATTVDPLLRGVPGCERLLAPAVSHARDYCTDIAARIPGPVEISRAAFAHDPLVHALFASADDIDHMLARSQCVREQLVAPSSPAALAGECCALLGMRHREKAGFGASLQGEVVRYDEPQRTLYFSDHTLAEPSPGLDEARQRLRDSMFDSLVNSVAAHVAEVRQEQQILRQDHAFAAAMTRAQSGPEAHTRRLAELQARLHATADALRPDKLLDTLCDCLAHPEPYLHLEPVTLCVDRNGVIGAPGDVCDGDTLRFVELTSRDKRRWVVLLARIDRQEACRAVAQFDEARRYIVI